MNTKASDLIDRLQSDVRKLILNAEKLRGERTDRLQMQPAENRWSVAQVLAHLNSYGNFYIPAISDAIDKSNKSARESYSAGWFGDYFTRLMMPKTDGSIGKKMKAPRNHTPALIANPGEVLDEFIEQQHHLLDLLQLARKKDIGAVRVPISISRLIKLKLGDTFRFLIAHEQRHFLQIKNNLIQLDN